MNNQLKAMLLIATLLFSAGSLAQQQSSQEQPETANKPYQVVITGKPTRAYYRELIQDVEDDYFEKFNELNDDDTYDVYCYEYTPTMSHIRKRACEPLFMIRQRADEGAAMAFAFGTAGVNNSVAKVANGAIGGLYNETEATRRSIHKSDYETLVEKLEELTGSNKELAEIANVMEQLKYRLENYEN